MSRSDQKTCDNCGSVRDVNDLFCGNCGKTLNFLGYRENNSSAPLTVYPERRQQSSTTPGQDNTVLSVYTPHPPPPTQSNKIYPVVIAVLATMLIGIGILELAQLVKGNQQENISNIPNPSSHSGTIPANTAQVSTTLSSTLVCPTSSGYFKIVNVNSGLVLEVPNGSLSSANIQQYSFDGGLNQQWQCIPVGEGYFKIANVNSDQVLDVPYASQNSKVSIQQYSYNAGLGQQWRFVLSN